VRADLSLCAGIRGLDLEIKTWMAAPSRATTDEINSALH
jgi:hypothetical protein